MWESYLPEVDTVLGAMGFQEPENDLLETANSRSKNAKRPALR